jgi:outer membrane protein TolC
VGVSLPVFELTPAPFDALAARRRVVDAEARATREELAVKVARAAHAVVDDRALLALLDGDGADVVAGSLDAVERALAAGEADVVQLSSVRARALKAERARARARLRCEEDALELMRLVGDDALVP